MGAGAFAEQPGCQPETAAELYVVPEAQAVLVGGQEPTHVAVDDGAG